MSQQLSMTPIKPLAYPSPPVKLWTPAVIGLITFLLGYPGGLVMAILNWIRMGLINKAINHLIVGVAGTLAYVVLSARLTEDVGRLFALMVNIAMITYLHNQMGQDIAAFKACNHEVQNAHWLGGLLIGIVMLGIFLALAFVVGVFMALLNVPFSE
jgi:hypothetical protein